MSGKILCQMNQK